MPPTPAEAPEAKRRKVARSRGSIALFVGVGVVFIAFTLFLLFRVGKQVGATEASVEVSASVATPAAPSAVAAPALSVGGSADFARTRDSATKGAGGAPNRRTRDVFRKPGF